MSVLALASVKAAPGVTTAAVALAAVWPPDREVVVVEADASGGSLAAQAGLRPEPGLTTLVAALRRPSLPGTVWEHVQPLGSGLPVVAAPSSPEQAHAALAAGTTLKSCLAEVAGDVIVDCGRLVQQSPAAPLALGADLLVFVARPRLADVVPLVHRLKTLRRQRDTLALLLVGDGPYGPREVEAATGTEVVGVLATDPPAAEALGTGRGSRRRIRRSPLVRTAHAVAQALATRLAAPVAPSERGPSGGTAEAMAEATR